MNDARTDLVRAFGDAFSRRETNELLGFFADDAVYHNMPMPPVSGKDAIRGVLDMFLKPTGSVEFIVVHIAAAGKQYSRKGSTGS